MLFLPANGRRGHVLVNFSDDLYLHRAELCVGRQVYCAHRAADSAEFLFVLLFWRP